MIQQRPHASVAYMQSTEWRGSEISEGEPSEQTRRSRRYQSGVMEGCTQPEPPLLLGSVWEGKSHYESFHISGQV